MEVKEGLGLMVESHLKSLKNEDITDYFLGHREKDLQIVTLETEKDFCDYLSLLSKPQLLLTSKV